MSGSLCLVSGAVSTSTTFTTTFLSWDTQPLKEPAKQSLSLSISQTPGNKGEDNIKEKCDEEEEEEEEPPSGEGGCRVSTHESVF